MFERLDLIEEKYNKLLEDLANPEIVSNIKKMTELSKEVSDIEKVVKSYKEYKNLLKEEVLITTFKNIANAPFDIEEITLTPNSFAVKMNEKEITSEKIWNIFNTLKSLVSGEHIHIKLNNETSITRMDGEIIICKKEITEEDIKKALWYSDERWGIPVIINDKVEIFESNVKIIGKIPKKLKKNNK